jgi:hypothetical protein
MTFYAHSDIINFSVDDTENVPNTFWNPEIDGDHWTESGVMDDNFGENAKRNNDIELLRAKYTAEKKSGGVWYEKQRQHTYKSKKAQKQFLKEIEESGLDLKLQCKNKYDDRLDILYCDPNNKHGRDPSTQEDPDDYYSFRDLNKYQKEEVPD